MARVTANGVEGRSLEEYVDLLGRRFRSALGSDLVLDAETPQGQLIGELALVFVELDEAIVAQGSAFALATAAGQQLDDLCSLLNVERRAVSRSTVNATLRGTPGSIIPAGSRAQTTAGDVFETSAVSQIGANGSVQATMRSTSYGPVPAPINSLTSVLTVVEGWDSVGNSTAAVLGRLRETDADLRARYRRERALNARGSRDALESAVLAVPGVTAARTTTNTTNAAITVRGESIPAHSVLVHVLGGADAAVQAAIVGALPLGIPYMLVRLTEIPISITISTQANAEFPLNGIEAIKDAVKDYIDDLRLTDGVIVDGLYRPIYSVAGHGLTATPTIARKTGSEGVATADLDGNEYLTVALADITVTLVQ